MRNWLEKLKQRGSWRRRRLPTLIVLLLLSTAGYCETRVPSEPRGKRIVWEVKGRGWAVTPAFDDSTVYFAGIDHEILAVDRRTGAVRWRQSTGAVGPWTFGYNVVRLGDLAILGDRDIYAFDAASGTLRWMYQPDDLDEPGRNYLFVDGATVYAGSTRGRVYALNATGTARWITQLPGDSSVRAFGPVVADGVVFVGIKEFTHYTTGGLAALDAATGAILWVTPFTPEVQGQGSASFGGAAVAGGLVMVGAEDGRIYGLNVTDGSVRWIAPRVHQLPPNGAFNDTRALAIVNGTLVAGSNSATVVGLDPATGAERWRQRPEGGSIDQPPAGDGQNAYVEFAGGQIIAFDAATGAIRWSAGITESSPGQFFQPIAADDFVFASGVNGFYALRKE
jgi:outer membrane protein assembly factor BamB